MKKARYIFSLILIIASSSAYSQSYDHNFVRERILRIEETDESQIGGLGVGEITELIAYSDGFGRNLQLINSKGSPSHNDIVAFSVYDEYGRTPTQYLPYVDQDDDGVFKTTALTDQGTFYERTPKIAHTLEPYSVTIFDESPLQKIEQQGAPGHYWQPNASTEHTTRFEYILNAEGEVRQWTINESTNQCSSSQSYGEKTLFLKITKDPNWDETNGGYVKEYRDKAGRVILRSARLNSNTYAKTYYVYDDFGNLRFVIPPKAVDLMEPYSFNTANLTQDLVYSFKYDERQRVIERKVPGKDEEYFVYDEMDRIVLTQDGNLRNLNKWQFIKYDIYSRPVMTGIYHDNTYTTLYSIQSYVDGYVNNTSTFYFEEPTDITTQTPDGYTLQSFPVSTGTDILKVIYYDNYDFDENGDYEFDDFTGLWDPLEDQPFYRIRGRVSGMKTAILGTDPKEWLYSVFYYDEDGRLIRMVSDNHLDGVEFVDNQYQFSGEVIQSYLYKSTNINSTLEETTIQYSYDRDEAGRLEILRSKINDENSVIMLNNKYNELGQLIEKNMHWTGGSSYLQSVDYRYHLWGMLKNINTGNLTNNNTTIDFDTEIQSDEMVYGIKFDTIGLSLEFDSLSGEPYKMQLNYTDSKKLLICKIDDPTDNRQLSVNETKTIYINKGSIADSLFNSLKSLDGNTYTIDFDNVKLDTYLSNAVVLDSLESIVQSELSSKGISADSVLYALRLQYMNFIADRVALIYYNEDNDDLFGMDLNYEANSSVTGTNPQYNGNISAIKWQCDTYGERQAYAYQYDNMGRFMNATYAEYSAGSGWTQNVNRFGVYNISYDLNGNILTLDRKGLTGKDQDQNSTYGIMDELTYTYDGNQLTVVEDDVDNTLVTSLDFRDNSSTGSNEYEHDDNGNMIRDDNKGITSVVYNHLNLPEKVSFGSQNYIKYTYDANGIKLTKKVYRGGSLDDQMDYSGIFVYKDENLEFILTGEGRAVKQTNGTYRYDYFLTDHLGNVRVTFTMDVNDNAEVVQENHYYPFGMTLGGLDYYSVVHNDFLYQGKEFQKDAFDLVGNDGVYETQFLWQDFHARFYDSQLGRWHVPDPILNEASPYIGMGNNPISLMDPDGMTPGGRKHKRRRPNESDLDFPTSRESRSWDDDYGYDGSFYIEIFGTNSHSSFGGNSGSSGTSGSNWGHGSGGGSSGGGGGSVGGGGPNFWLIMLGIDPAEYRKQTIISGLNRKISLVMSQLQGLANLTSGAFNSLWDNYPQSSIIHTDQDPNKDIFANHCAIDLSESIIANGIVLNGGTRCYGSCPRGKGSHFIKAAELSEALKTKYNYVELNGNNYLDFIDGKKGIIYFENYWQRDRQTGLQGDHIDLWNGSYLKSLGWFMTRLRLNFPSIMKLFDRSDYSNSSKIIFWEVKD